MESGVSGVVVVPATSVSSVTPETSSASTALHAARCSIDRCLKSFPPVIMISVTRVSVAVLEQNVQGAHRATESQSLAISTRRVYLDGRMAVQDIVLFFYGKIQVGLGRFSESLADSFSNFSWSTRVSDFLVGSSRVPAISATTLSVVVTLIV